MTIRKTTKTKIKKMKLGKTDLARKVQKRLFSRGVYATVNESEYIIDSLVQEILAQVGAGNTVHLNQLGRIYPKYMKPRTVVCGWEEKGTKYKVKSKYKVGLSSFESVDEVLTKKAKRSKRA